MLGTLCFCQGGCLYRVIHCSRLDQMVGLGCMELSNGPGLESNDPIMLILWVNV